MATWRLKEGPDEEGVGGDRSYAVQKGLPCQYPVVQLAYLVTMCYGLNVGVLSKFVY